MAPRAHPPSHKQLLSSPTVFTASRCADPLLFALSLTLTTFLCNESSVYLEKMTASAPVLSTALAL